MPGAVCSTTAVTVTDFLLRLRPTTEAKTENCRRGGMHGAASATTLHTIHLPLRPL
jgi:hypothetical protein